MGARVRSEETIVVPGGGIEAVVAEGSVGGVIMAAMKRGETIVAGEGSGGGGGGGSIVRRGSCGSISISVAAPISWVGWAWAKRVCGGVGA